MQSKENKDNDASKIRVDGKIIAVLPDTKYKVEIDVEGFKHTLTGYISGKIRQNYIRLGVGDNVIVEIAPEYDLNIGRIVYKKDRRNQLINPVAQAA